MSTRKFFSFLFLLFYFSESLATFEILQWDESRVDAKVGESTNITCKASVRSYFDVVRIQAAYDHGTNLTISDGRDIKSPFSKLQRLEIEYGVENQNVFHATLIFKDLKGEDSGTYYCSRLGDPDKKVAKVHLHVHVPVESVSWFNDLASSFGEDVPPPSSSSQEMVTLHLRESEEATISCLVRVEGTTDTPHVKVLLDGSEDITNFFTELEDPRVIKTEDGFERVHSVTRLIYSTFHPLPLHQGHNLTCTAEVGNNKLPGSKELLFEPKSATARLFAEFAPVFTCQKYHYHVSLHSNISVPCLLLSNPQSTLNWSMSRAQDSPVIPPTGVQIVQKLVGLNKYQVIFQVNDLDVHHMGEYLLTATNDISSQGVTVVLTLIQPLAGKAESMNLARFDALTGSTSSPYSILSTIFLLIASVFFCIILH